MNLDLNNIGSTIGDQFRNLSGRHPGMWPIAPRLLCGLGVVVGVLAAGHFLYWDNQFNELENGRGDEVKLKEDFKSKLSQAINLEALKAQKVQIDRYVDQLQKQLPGKAEMDALLSDINQAGVGRGLQFELFKPGQIVVKDYYAEQPIDIRVTGSYHDIGSFVSDMAKLPRIVTLNNMTLTTKDNGLLLEAVAKTFRYLDPDEVAAQRKAENEKKVKGGKK